MRKNEEAGTRDRRMVGMNKGGGGVVPAWRRRVGYAT